MSDPQLSLSEEGDLASLFESIPHAEMIRAGIQRRAKEITLLRQILKVADQAELVRDAREQDGAPCA